MLSLFHYVLAGITALFSLIPIIHVVIGFMLLNGQFAEAQGSPPPGWMGWLFVLVGSTFILVGLAFAFCLFLTARHIRHRQQYTFVIVVAAVECLFVPLGTILGVFTIIVLNKPITRALFGKPEVG